MALHNPVYTHCNFGWPVERVAVLVLCETSHFHWKHTFGVKTHSSLICIPAITTHIKVWLVPFRVEHKKAFHWKPGMQIQADWYKELLIGPVDVLGINVLRKKLVCETRLDSILWAWKGLSCHHSACFVAMGSPKSTPRSVWSYAFPFSWDLQLCSRQVQQPKWTNKLKAQRFSKQTFSAPTELLTPAHTCNLPHSKKVLNSDRYMILCKVLIV